MSALTRDLRYALRALAQAPTVTFIIVAVLALGIGATTAIFSVFDQVLLRPSPFASMDRLMMVWETDRHSGTTREPASIPDYLDFAERSRRFGGLAAFAAGEATLVPDRGEPVRLAAMAVTHNFLPLVGIDTLAGRHFSREDDRRGSENVVLISEALWRRVLGGKPGAIGQSLRLDDEAYRVAGVVPASAEFGALQILSAAAYARGFADRGVHTQVDLWLPLRPDHQTSSRHNHPIFVVGRLAPDATRDAAHAEMSSIAADLERRFRDANDGRGTFVEPLRDVVFGPVKPPLTILIGAVGLLLLIAAANVANLLLVRGTARGREVALRSALGATAFHLGRQFLAEGLLLTLVSAAAGVTLATIALPLLVSWAPPETPRLHDVQIDWRILSVTLGVTIVVGIAFALVTMWQAWKVDVLSALKGESGYTASAGREGGRLRAALVAGQFALAMMLLVGVGLLLRSFWQVWRVDPGFDAGGVLKVEYQLPGSRYPARFADFPNFKEMHAFNRALVERVSGLPGVESAAIAGTHPLDPGFTNSFVVVGREDEARDWPEISLRNMTPGYFKTLQVARVEGRLFEESDGVSTPPVALINQTAARRFFTRQSPVGQRLAFWGITRTIVGVVADERTHGLTTATPPAVYVPLAQAPSRGAHSVLVRTRRPPMELAAAVRRAIHDLDPQLAVFAVEPLEETLARSVGTRRFTLLLSALLGAVALLLAAVALHGALSYDVSQRTREIGIRLALGADASGVRRLVFSRGLLIVFVGVALGLIGAFAVARLIASQLYEVAPTDPLTFLLVAVVLAVVALVACYVPTRRALRVNPMVALRTE
jgi:putative ABC transport system permease protein